MYRVLPNPLGGMMLVNEKGVVKAAGSNVTSLRSAINIMMERREINPFIVVTDEFGKPVTIKDYVRRG